MPRKDTRCRIGALNTGCDALFHLREARGHEKREQERERENQKTDRERERERKTSLCIERPLTNAEPKQKVVNKIRKPSCLLSQIPQVQGECENVGPTPWAQRPSDFGRDTFSLSTSLASTLAAKVRRRVMYQCTRAGCVANLCIRK